MCLTSVNGLVLLLLLLLDVNSFFPSNHKLTPPADQQQVVSEPTLTHLEEVSAVPFGTLGWEFVLPSSREREEGSTRYL
uniref:Putative secreted protein n=1 Tax=Anopheles marajoara TaxID=58244 RepID=A0A2M4CC11_9DIPT